MARLAYGAFARTNFDAEVPPEDAARLVEATGGRIFSAVFSRRCDGRLREMTCRTGVGAHRAGVTVA